MSKFGTAVLPSVRMCGNVQDLGVRFDLARDVPRLNMAYDLPSYGQAMGQSCSRPFLSDKLDTEYRETPQLLGLPDHLLLAILSHCTFVNLQITLRPTCRRLNLFCLSLLRKAALPHYRQRCLPPYAIASDPLKQGRAHEIQVLDKLIAALAYLGRLRYETNLHILAGEELQQAYPELFDSLQPQALLQDLVQGKLCNSPFSTSTALNRRVF